MRVSILFMVVSSMAGDYSKPLRAWKNREEAETVKRKLEKRWRRWSDYHYRHNDSSDDVDHVSYYVTEVELSE